MNTSTLEFKPDSIFCDSKTGLVGKFSKVKNDITLEYPGLVLPGEKNTIPVTLEAVLNEDRTGFKGSIYNKAYSDGRMCVNAVKINDDKKSFDDEYEYGFQSENGSEDEFLSVQEVEDIIHGTWNIEYRKKEINQGKIGTDTTIEFKSDGTFHQKAGNYNGTWICSQKGKLKITFDNVKINDSKVVLKARVRVGKRLSDSPFTFSGNNHEYFNFVAFKD
ncbi:MAG: hypothetical protein WD512_19465 [Candidatus Paceibacterota bacterium]